MDGVVFVKSGFNTCFLLDDDRPSHGSPEGATEGIDIKRLSPLAGLNIIKHPIQGFASLTPGYFLIAPSGLDERPVSRQKLG